MTACNVSQHRMLGARLWLQVYQSLTRQGVPDALLVRGCIDEDDAVELCGLVKEARPMRILEVGAFVGMSTGVLALASESDAHIVSVDPNLPMRVQGADFGFSDDRRPLSFLLTMLRDIGQQDKVSILTGFFSRPPSESLAKQLEQQGVTYKNIEIKAFDAAQLGPYDFVFVDGDHRAEAVCSDLSFIESCLSANGIIAIHDVTGDWSQEVAVGIQLFCKEHVSYSFRALGNLGFLAKG